MIEKLIYSGMQKKKFKITLDGDVLSVTLGELTITTIMRTDDDLDALCLQAILAHKHEDMRTENARLESTVLD